MEIWKGNGNTTTLSFYVKGLQILLQVRRQLNTIVMEHVNRILFYKSVATNK